MKMIIAKNQDEASNYVANRVADTVRNHDSACLGLATGGSMEGIYAHLVKLFLAGDIHFKSVKTANLDEYVGLPPSHPQSYRKYMDQHFFDHVDIDKANTYIPLGMKPPESMCKDFQDFLDSHPRDLQLLGVGANGHIGFNEPGPTLESKAHIITLNDQTREDNARFFTSVEEVPVRAVTMGVGDIMKASQIVMLIHGTNKLKAIQELFTHDRVDPGIPCTVLKLHRDATVVLSEELASLANLL